MTEELPAMDSFIFQQANSPKETEEKYYCILGSEDYVDDEGFPRKKNIDNSVVARSTPGRDSCRHFIRISQNKKLYNPISVMDDDRSSDFLDSVCRSSDSFKSVNNKIFSMYLNFLISKNIAWLHRAEREMA